jgi:hypothetical protein
MKAGIGLSIGVTLGGNNPSALQTTLIESAFKTRVAADSGLFEAESCLDILLTNLNKI